MPQWHSKPRSQCWSGRKQFSVTWTQSLSSWYTFITTVSLHSHQPLTLQTGSFLPDSGKDFFILYSFFIGQCKQNIVFKAYINLIITILDIIHHPVFILNHNVSNTKFSVILQVETRQLGPIDRASHCIRPNWVGSSWRLRLFTFTGQWSVIDIRSQMSNINKNGTNT
jgi:hypothetical protein